jgi:hypothetical protein
MLVALLTMLMAVGSVVPTASQAAPVQHPATQQTLAGTLVATPQATRPTTLLLQVGGQTLPVTLTASTRVIDRASQPLSLTTMHDGDSLIVTGTSTAAGGIIASIVVDLTTPVQPAPPPVVVQVLGTLASMPATNVLCLLNARVTSSTATPRLSTATPCPAGQLPVYLTSGTRFIGRAGQAFTRTDLRVGDALHLGGPILNGLLTATAVHDLTRPVQPAPPPVVVQMLGTLASMPATNVLCLLNARVTSSTATPRLSTTAPCPAGQLPVYAISTTRIMAPNGGALRLYQLHAGDTLHVTGTVAGGRLTASVITVYPNARLTNHHGDKQTNQHGNRRHPPRKSKGHGAHQAMAGD